jgi:PilZ domain
MKGQRFRERRIHPRHPTTGLFQGKELPTYNAQKRLITVRGRLRDLSEGGVCLITDQPLERSHLVRGELHFENLPVPIPTLMLVRWTEKHAERQEYASGLRFVF